MNELLPIGILAGITILAVIFFALRKLLLWYWKIDKLIELQEEGNRIQKAIYKTMVPEKTDGEIEIMFMKPEKKYMQ